MTGAPDEASDLEKLALKAIFRENDYWNVMYHGLPNRMNTEMSD